MKDRDREDDREREPERDRDYDRANGANGDDRKGEFSKIRPRDLMLTQARRSRRGSTSS